MPVSAKKKSRSESHRPSTRGEPAATAPRTRLARGARENRIVADAARYFAEHGFTASTRDIAGSMRVTQALLYRYFPSKQALIDRVFEYVFIDRWDPAWSDLIGDRTLPLVQRLTQFYQAYIAGISYTSLRLFLRAALDGQDFAARYTFPLNDRLLRPVIGELRHDAGLPSLGRRPLRNGEWELAMMLHGSLIFLAIRKHIYMTPLPGDLGHHVSLMVEIFAASAPEQIKALHRQSAPGIFRMPLVGGKR